MNQAPNKHFISANELLVDSFTLAQNIYRSGYRPDFIIGVWRGGAPIGIAIQEYFEYMHVPTDHIAIRTSSYYGINQQDKNVRVHGLDYVLENVSAEDEVLLVDDVFDSGRSIKAILDHMSLKNRNNLAQSMKIACPWYKPSHNVTDYAPDFYLHETSDWLVFPHELTGLSSDEIRRNKPDIAKIIDTIWTTKNYKVICAT